MTSTLLPSFSFSCYNIRFFYSPPKCPLPPFPSPLHVISSMTSIVIKQSENRDERYSVVLPNLILAYYQKWEINLYISIISNWVHCTYIVSTWPCLHQESESNEFKPPLKSAKNWFKLSAGLNLETFNTFLNGTSHIWPASWIEGAAQIL